MHAAAFALLAVIVPLAAVALAASSSREEAPGAPPRPHPDLAHLAACAGVWDAEIEMMGAVSKGVETCRMALGGFWLVTEFEGSFMGAPFEGHGLTGFDPARGKIVNVWADSTGSPPTIAEGAFEASGTKLVAEAQGLDMSGEPARFKHVTTFVGRDARTFEMFQRLDGGREELAMRIRYRRR
jgi:hypothetical protein